MDEEKRRVVVVETPPGQAPLRIREQWRGVVLPIEKDPSSTRIQVGVGGGLPQNSGGYVVRASTAFSALAETAPEAADWWRGLISDEARLVFRRESCRLLPASPRRG